VIKSIQLKAGEDPKPKIESLRKAGYENIRVVMNKNGHWVEGISLLTNDEYFNAEHNIK